MATTFDVLINTVRKTSEGFYLQGVKQITSKNTGEIHNLLMFTENNDGSGDRAEVVMPGSWAIREDEFPNGLYKGIQLDAGWTTDKEGNQRFYLRETK